MKRKETKKKIENKTFQNRSNMNGLEKYVLATLMVILAVVTALLISFKDLQNSFKISETNKSNCEINCVHPHKTFWVYGRNIESGFLNNVFAVLDRLGYKNKPNTTEWDLLWSHDYPFRTLYPQLQNMKSHQKVNHFPGCGYITNKVELATSGLNYIPKAFRLPKDKDELIKYAQDNPNKQFVEKNNHHRNIKIKRLEEIDLDSNDTFVQEFVDKPLLVSGYKFDIGIYMIITSIDPLRFYIYNGDALLRFCPNKYYPFDANNLDKYIIGDDYLPPWQVPELTYYYETLRFGMKESLNAFLRSKNKNPDVIWQQIEDALRVVLLTNEPKLIEATNRFKSKDNFFEMMRFDFVVDEDLKVYLMEANMSPNLSSAHFPPNQLLFQQIIFNLMGLVGIGERLSRASLSQRSDDEELMMSSQKNIAVFPEICSSKLCRAGCVSPDCHLCQPCLTAETKTSLLQAYREQMNKGDCKRIFPPIMNRQTANVSLNFEDYSAMNQLMYKWYQGKCLLDAVWCN